jgi:hypothetical protein
MHQHHARLQHLVLLVFLRRIWMYPQKMKLEIGVRESIQFFLAAFFEHYIMMVSTFLIAL